MMNLNLNKENSSSSSPSPFTEWMTNINSHHSHSSSSSLLTTTIDPLLLQQQQQHQPPGEDFVMNCIGPYLGQSGKDFNILKIARKIFDEKILPLFESLDLEISRRGPYTVLDFQLASATISLADFVREADSIRNKVEEIRERKMELARMRIFYNALGINHNNNNNNINTDHSHHQYHQNNNKNLFTTNEDAAHVHTTTSSSIKTTVTKEEDDFYFAATRNLAESGLFGPAARRYEHLYATKAALQESIRRSDQDAVYAKRLNESKKGMQALYVLFGSHLSVALDRLDAERHQEEYFNQMMMDEYTAASRNAAGTTTSAMNNNNNNNNNTIPKDREYNHTHRLTPISILFNTKSKYGCYCVGKYTILSGRYCSCKDFQLHLVNNAGSGGGGGGGGGGAAVHNHNNNNNNNQTKRESSSSSSSSSVIMCKHLLALHLAFGFNIPTLPPRPPCQNPPLTLSSAAAWLKLRRDYLEAEFLNKVSAKICECGVYLMGLYVTDSPNATELRRAEINGQLELLGAPYGNDIARIIYNLAPAEDEVNEEQPMQGQEQGANRNNNHHQNNGQVLVGDDAAGTDVRDENAQLFRESQQEDEFSLMNNHHQHQNMNNNQNRQNQAPPLPLPLQQHHQQQQHQIISSTRNTNKYLQSQVRSRYNLIKQMLTQRPQNLTTRDDLDAMMLLQEEHNGNNDDDDEENMNNNNQDAASVAAASSLEARTKRNQQQQQQGKEKRSWTQLTGIEVVCSGTELRTNQHQHQQQEKRYIYTFPRDKARINSGVDTVIDECEVGVSEDGRLRTVVEFHVPYFSPKFDFLHTLDPIDLEEVMILSSVGDARRELKEKKKQRKMMLTNHQHQHHANSTSFAQHHNTNNNHNYYNNNQHSLIANSLHFSKRGDTHLWLHCLQGDTAAAAFKRDRLLFFSGSVAWIAASDVEITEKMMKPVDDAVREQILKY